MASSRHAVNAQLKQAYSDCVDVWNYKEPTRAFCFSSQRDTLYTWEPGTGQMCEFDPNTNQCFEVWSVARPVQLESTVPQPPVQLMNPGCGAGEAAAEETLLWLKFQAPVEIDHAQLGAAVADFFRAQSIHPEAQKKLQALPDVGKLHVLNNFDLTQAVASGNVSKTLSGYISILEKSPPWRNQKKPTVEAVLRVDPVGGCLGTCIPDFAGFKGIAPEHCRISFEKSDFWVTDLGYAGGTLVDGREIAQPTRLASGSVLELPGGCVIACKVQRSSVESVHTDSVETLKQLWAPTQKERLDTRARLSKYKDRAAMMRERQEKVGGVSLGATQGLYAKAKTNLELLKEREVAEKQEKTARAQREAGLATDGTYRGDDDGLERAGLGYREEKNEVHAQAGNGSSSSVTADLDYSMKSKLHARKRYRELLETQPTSSSQQQQSKRERRLGMVVCAMSDSQDRETVEQQQRKKLDMPALSVEDPTVLLKSMQTANTPSTGPRDGADNSKRGSDEDGGEGDGPPTPTFGSFPIEASARPKRIRVGFAEDQSASDKEPPTAHDGSRNPNRWKSSPQVFPTQRGGASAAATKGQGPQMTTPVVLVNGQKETNRTLGPPPPPKKSKPRAQMSQLAFMQQLALDRNPLAHVDRSIPLTMEEVAKHKSRRDCWMVVNGVVYDVTRYLPAHPGGKGELMRGAGKDATELYNQYHPWVSAEAILGKLRVGYLVTETAKPSGSKLLAPRQTGPQRTTVGHGSAVALFQEDELLHTDSPNANNPVENVAENKSGVVQSMVTLVQDIINRALWFRS